MNALARNKSPMNIFPNDLLFTDFAKYRNIFMHYIVSNQRNSDRQ
jgi:hypothetical protein